MSLNGNIDSNEWVKQDNNAVAQARIENVNESCSYCHGRVDGRGWWLLRASGLVAAVGGEGGRK